VILMAGWYGRLGVRLRAFAHAPRRLHELRHTAASLAIEACAHLEADPSTPRSPTTFDRYGHLLPGMDEALAEEMDGSDGRLSSEGIARDAMTHTRWGRVLKGMRLRSAGLP
jgi:hypothetical protein